MLKMTWRDVLSLYTNQAKPSVAAAYQLDYSAHFDLSRHFAAQMLDNIALWTEV